MNKSIKIALSVVIVAVLVVAAGFIINWSNQNKDGVHTVTSKDGTKITYEKSGSGRPVILVGGALSSRVAHAELAQLLKANFTVYNFDRRAHGDSGDTKPYAVAREIEDIEAIIERAGGSAYVYGISSGACLALETAAALGNKVDKLALYEAPYDESPGAAESWRTYSAKINELTAADRRADAVEFHLKFVGVPDKTLEEIKASPAWAGMVALAHTIPYDIAVVGEDRMVPAARAVKIQAKSLVMDGGASAQIMPYMRATAEKIANTIPGGVHKTIDGQSHNVSSKVIAPVLQEFFSK